MFRNVIVCIFVSAVLFLAGCDQIIVGGGTDWGGGGGGPPPAGHKVDKRGPLNIPPGHLPPPGKCRIWYPGQPPGQQPPPGPCRSLARQVPKGAWLISKPSGKGKNSKNVDVSVYDSNRAGLVLVIRTYRASTGIFISERRP
ncbi:MAG: hypothetical protein V3W31_01630 [Thermodesulfobacteriota bacterium]